MAIYFENEKGTCACNNCFYSFNGLKLFDFKIFEEENVFVPDGTLITPALVSQILEACQRIFRRQYNLEPKTLQALCMSKIHEKS